MVAIIKSSAAIRRPFHYNENKLKDGDAVLLSAVNYPGNSVEQSPENRLNYLLKMTALNKKTKVNSIHISLNFAPNEKLEKEKLIRISKEYMKGIGFENQPYLVYQHHDAGHPHLHIVSTNIQLDGQRISLHNIGKSKSEPTRKAIEKQYGLVKAEDQKAQTYLSKRVDLSMIEYGKTETKRAIGNVLQHVLKNYHYTTLPELNAVLKGYNIVADRGGEGSRIYKNRGLVYRVLDENGEKVGVPIKSSLFHFKATLAEVESKFESNGITRKKYQAELKSVIGFVLLDLKKSGIENFIQRLGNQGISVVKRENQEGRLYGLTYVDHRNKVVFNGSSLGKEYSAKGIIDRLGEKNSYWDKVPKLEYPTFQNPKKVKELNLKITRGLPEINRGPISFRSPFLELFKPEDNFSHIPFAWRRRRKKRKRKVSK